MGEFVWVTAVRDTGPAEVLAAAEEYFTRLAVGHTRTEPEGSDLVVFEPEDRWTVVSWPGFWTHDEHSAAWLSRLLDALVSGAGTADSEGWYHHAYLNGTRLDRFHSSPVALAWELDEVPRLAVEWSGDPALVAGAFGVPEAAVAAHLVQAGPDDEDHPALDGWGFVAFWETLGITYPDRVPVHGALRVDQGWRDLGVLDPAAG